MRTGLQASWQERLRRASWPAGWKAEVLLRTALLQLRGLLGVCCLLSTAQPQHEVTFLTLLQGIRRTLMTHPVRDAMQAVLRDMLFKEEQT